MNTSPVAELVVEKLEDMNLTIQSELAFNVSEMHTAVLVSSTKARLAELLLHPQERLPQGVATVIWGFNKGGQNVCTLETLAGVPITFLFLYV